MEEVAPDRRMSVLKGYLKRALDARVHIPIRVHRSRSSSGCRPGSPSSGSCRGTQREHAARNALLGLGQRHPAREHPRGHHRR